MFVHRLRKTLRSFRLPTYAVLSVFVWQSAGLTNYATALETTPPVPPPAEASPWQDITEKLMSLRDTLSAMRESIDGGGSGAPEQAAASALWQEIAGHYEAVREADVENDARYEGEFQFLSQAIADMAAKSSPESRLDAANRLLQVLEGARKPRPERLDPSQLPHRATDKAPPEPRVGRDAPQAPPLRVAAVGGFLPVQSGGEQPTDADSQETLEVQCTPEINALAANLGNDPVRMFEHVRNGYDFQPTWGSIKGSQATYFSTSGNAHDLSSLLIALYRCSNIPARYVHGTIDVPLERFVKWAGIENPDQASSLFSSGGIPATLVSVNGTPEFVRLEHIWVKAYVDYTPSRGGVFVQGDRWVEMDPSYKEYEVVEPIDLVSALDADEQALLTTLEASATATDNSLTSVDFDASAGTRSAVEAQIQALIAGNGLNNLDELLGDKRKMEKRYGVLPITSNFQIVTSHGEYAELPAAHRYSITVTLSDVDGFGFPTQSFNHQVALPALSSKRFTLTYSPANAQTTTYLQNLAAPLAGGTLEQQVAATPRTLSAPSVLLIPELKIAGAIVASGAAVGLGYDQEMRIRINSPNGFANADFTNTISAGSSQGIVMDVGPWRSDYTATRKANLEAIKAELDNPPADLNDLNVPKDEYAGELLYMAGVNYWSLQNTFNSLIQRINDTTATRLPSVGLFSYDLTIVFGGFITPTPQSATIAGFGTDIDFDLQAVVSNTSDRQGAIAYMLSSGMMGSYLEGSIWDLILSDLTNETNDLTGRGVSSAHVLAFANANDIPVFVTDSDNWAAVQPQLSLPGSVLTAVGQAVAAGKMVTVPQTAVTIDQVPGVAGSGWTGVGYIVSDKDSGAGAYLIDGGRAGGGFDLPNLDPSTVLILGFLLLAVGVFFPAVAAIAGVIAIALGIYDFISTAQDIYNNDDLTGDQQDMLVGLLGAFAVVGLIIGLIGLTSLGTAVPFLAIAMAFLFYAFMVALIVGALANLMADINQRNNQLPWLRRRTVPLWESLFALLRDGDPDPDPPGREDPVPA